MRLFKKRFKRKFLVIDSEFDNGNTYDHIFLNNDGGMSTIRVRLFQIGRIIILNDRGSPYGRDYLFCEKPSKWFVTWKLFDDLEKAIKYSREVYNKFEDSRELPKERVLGVVE